MKRFTRYRSYKAPFALTMALLGGSSASCVLAEDGDAPWPADGEEISSAELNLLYSPQVQAALDTGDASGVTKAELLSALQQRIDEIKATRQATTNAIFRLNPDGSLAANSIVGITWNPSPESAYMTVDMELHTPLFTSNISYKSQPKMTTILGVTGQTGAARYAVLSANPLHDLKRTTELPAGSGNAALQAALEGTAAWLTENPSLKNSIFKVVLAHLPDVSYFRQDVTTRKWFTDTYPGVVTNNEDACEGAALPGCLSGADLLVLGNEAGSGDVEYPNTNLNVDAVMATVNNALDAGTPVLYLQYDDVLTALGKKLMSRFNIAMIDNYYRQDGLSGWDPTALAAGDATLTALASLRDTLATDSLLPEDFSPCLSGNTLGGLRWNSCEEAAFKAKVRNGADYLRVTLNQWDTTKSTPLFSVPGNDLLKLFVLLGDKFRAGDATTPALAYPVPWATDPNALARAVLVDSTVLYNRSAAPKQKNLGSFICTRPTVQNNTCVPYDPNAIPTVSEAVSTTVPSNNEWTSTGFYALPGKPFTVTRPAGFTKANISVRLNFQRNGTTRSLEKAGAFTKYDRPQYLQSVDIPLAVGETRTLTSPYGGPIYMVMGGSAATVGQTASLSFTNVAKHAALLDATDTVAVSQFLTAVQQNPLPHVDIRSVGFEAHLRKDKFLTGAQDAMYGGNIQVLLDDFRFNFVEVIHLLAGLKPPGKALAQSLSDDVKAICSSFGWNCLDETLHLRNSTQHVNYDENSQCGNLCAGNPFDSDSYIKPIGWGESHEFGHNLQVSELNVNYVAEASRNTWTSYSNRSGEVSNNIFPYHTLWRYHRIAKGNNGLVTDGHMNTKDLFAIVQSDIAGLKKADGTRVLFNPNCTVFKTFPAGTTANRFEALWEPSGTYDNNGLRMAFYLGIPTMLDELTMANGTVLHNGFDIVTLLYLQQRLFRKAAASSATWLAARAGLGFGTFPYDAHATYGGGKIGNIPGNDFLLVALAYITKLDFRPYFNSRGVRYSDLASAQVDAHKAAGIVTMDAPTTVDALGTNLPTLNLSATPKVALDGVSLWPGDNFNPSKCPIP